MQDETTVEAVESNDLYQVFVNDITWSKDTIGKFRSKHSPYDQLPRQMSFILPDSIVKKENSKDFYDIVETFIYNLLAKRYNRIVYHCQIWLAWDKEDEVVS